MTRRFRLRAPACTALAAACALGPLAPVALAQATAANKGGMTVALQLSGGYHFKGTFSHAEDSALTTPTQFSCVKLTKPNFAPKGQPLAYALSFNNPSVTSSGGGGVFLSFYYNPKLTGFQRVDSPNATTQLFVVPKANENFGLGGAVGSYRVMVKLGADGRGGTFMATGLDNIVGAEKHVSATGSWSCPTLFVRTT